MEKKCIGHKNNNKKGVAQCLDYFFQGKNYRIILAKNGLGYFLGHFFTNSSGHPA
jgi:hypothetical protein